MLKEGMTKVIKSNSEIDDQILSYIKRAKQIVERSVDNLDEDIDDNCFAKEPVYYNLSEVFKIAKMIQKETLENGIIWKSACPKD